MELVLELNESRRPLRLAVDGNGAFKTIEDELKKCKKEISLSVCSSDDRPTASEVYILQKWSNRWSCFVDVIAEEDLADGDRITAIQRRSTSEVQELGTKASAICSRSKKPNKADARVLSGLFASSSSSSRKRTNSFDPTEECVATAQQKKKKRAIRFKPSKVTVLLVGDIKKGVPRGKCRRELKKNGFEACVELKRNMSAQEVKNVILRAFDTEAKVTDYQVLSSSQDAKLCVAEHQHPNGEDIIEKTSLKKSPLYICRREQTDDSLSQIHERADAVLASLRAPVPLSPLSPPSPLSPVYVSSESDCDEGTITSEGHSKEQQLAEFRQTRAEQDREFDQSLLADQLKAADREKEVQEIQTARTQSSALRSSLSSKYRSNSTEGVKIAFRLTDGSKVEHCFRATAFTQDLYEFVFVRGQDCPFTLLQAIPQQVIPLSTTTTLEDLDLRLACVLTVVEKEDSPDPLSFLSHLTSTCSDVQEHAEDLTVLKAAEREREDYSNKYLNAYPPYHGHSVRRSLLYEDVTKLYGNREVACEYPFRVAFEGEQAEDGGGVSRDMLSGFWEEAYRSHFDGCALLTPVLHPQVNLQLLPVFGRIVSHGYLACGFLPVRIAFPTLACLLLGPNTIISDKILLECFPDCLSEYEADVIRQALSAPQAFSATLKRQLVAVLSRFGSREIPSCNTIKEVMVNIARYEFVVKPLAAVSLIHNGIPASHAPFWCKKTVDDLRSLYLAMTATPAKIVEILECDACHESENRVLEYVQQFIGNMSPDVLRRFLRFTTGSSVCLAKKITLTFNNLSGFARRPISHTCDCVLELSTSYATYPEFVQEFETVLSQPEISWTMDAV